MFELVCSNHVFSRMEEIHWDFCFPVVMVVFVFIYQDLGFVLGDCFAFLPW